MQRLNSLPDTLNRQQLLFGINQGCTYDALRIENMKQIAALNLDGYAIGGLAVGESEGRDVSHYFCGGAYMPKDKPVI